MSGAPEDNGADLDAQIRSGVEAYLQSQDPAIAVEVINMLAQVMGIAPSADPYAGMDPGAVAGQTAAPAAAAPAPMASAGMRLYKRGGKIVRFAKGGKPGGPKPKQRTVTSQITTGSTAKGEVFAPQDRSNPGSTLSDRYTTPGLTKSLRETPAKGLKRQSIQDAGLAGGDITQAGGYRLGNAAAYDFGNRKAELAGQFKQLEFKVPGFQHTLPVPETELTPTPTLDVTQIPGAGGSSGIPAATRPTKTAAQIREQNGRGSFGREDAVPVPWVEGQRSGPNGFKATKKYKYKDRAKKNLGR